ncbi:hypothetical protein [Chryseobacterium sp. ERMR1:04]|uniref:hypothetical protein n=1 Tax=Chryseobacterium sp. ERMR1:04 TaxID=1705393 RepID=UPI0006C87441|nr:hypothetical protein [Chryseobacterium sp. ERMR1:04]KPH12844.1 hypothetical protein AMQ68_14350 [Chryseobacterium sp. ERMR1:04]
MRKILIIVLSLILTNCIAQKKETAFKKYNKIKIPNINNIRIPQLSELVDMKNDIIEISINNIHYRKPNDSIKEDIAMNVKRIGKYSMSLPQNNLEDLEISLQKDPYYIEKYTFKNDKLIKIVTKLDDKNLVPRENKYFESGYFEQAIHTVIDFYPTKKIHIVRQYNSNSNGSFPAGDWYIYDETGKILKHINHEKIYRMSYYQIAQIADKYNYPSTKIRRVFDDKNSYWEIILEGYQDLPYEKKIVFINDKTQEIVYEIDQQNLSSFKGLNHLLKFQENLYDQFN